MWHSAAIMPLRHLQPRCIPLPSITLLYFSQAVRRGLLPVVLHNVGCIVEGWDYLQICRSEVPEGLLNLVLVRTSSCLSNRCPLPYRSTTQPTPPPPHSCTDWANMLLLLHLWALPRWGLLSQVIMCATSGSALHCTREGKVLSPALLTSACQFPASCLPQATFAFNTGPLTWSILAFRNSLVFHDLDKVSALSLDAHTI